MSLEKLLRDRIIQRIRIDRNLTQKTFSIATRDLETAKSVLEGGSYSWSLAIAYNAMLQAGRALMFSKGFKPAGQYQHVAVVRFLQEIFSKELTERLISILDRIAKRDTQPFMKNQRSFLNPKRKTLFNGQASSYPK